MLLPLRGSCNLTHATCALESRTAMLCITRRYVESLEVLPRRHGRMGSRKSEGPAWGSGAFRRQGEWGALTPLRDVRMTRQPKGR